MEGVGERDREGQMEMEKDQGRGTENCVNVEGEKENVEMFDASF